MKWWMILALAAAAFLAACDSRGNDGPPSPAATATVTPTVEEPTRPPATPSLTIAPATPTPPRTPTPVPTATATSGATGMLVEHGDRASGMVALSFDMGGRVEPALEIMAWLVANRVPATIFMTGAVAESANTDAGRQVLAMVDAHPALFALGNHSYSHPDFRDLSEAQILAELASAEQAITRHSSTSPRPFFRPPFGGQDVRVVAAAAAAGYPRTILWDVDTIDWKPEADGGPTVAEVVAKVRSRAQGGSIVLMHLGGYNTLEALPEIVAALAAHDLRPVTLTTLLGD